MHNKTNQSQILHKHFYPTHTKPLVRAYELLRCCQHLIDTLLRACTIPHSSSILYDHSTLRNDLPLICQYSYVHLLLVLAMDKPLDSSTYIKNLVYIAKKS